MSENDLKDMNFLEKAICIGEKYSIWKVIKGLFIVFAFIFVVYSGQNITSIIQRAVTEAIRVEYDKDRSDKQETIIEHNEALKYRQTISPKIELLLRDILDKCDADRAFVIEMHNGTNNTSGLPFYYGEMTYEVVSKGIEHVDEDYQNLNLSRFSFVNRLITENEWHGHIDELHEIDEKLGLRMKSNGVSYISMICIQGIDNAIGFLGVTYCNGKVPSDAEKMEKYTILYSQRLSRMLDAKFVFPDN